MSTNVTTWLSELRECRNIATTKNIEKAILDDKLDALLLLMGDNPISFKIQSNFESFLHCLLLEVELNHISEYLEDIKNGKSTKIEQLFLKYPPYSALISLTSILTKLSVGIRQDLCLALLESYLKKGRFKSLLLLESLATKNRGKQEDVLAENLLTSLSSLPDRIANNTRGKFSFIFHHQQFFQLLAIQTSDLIEILVTKIQNDEDIFVNFLTQMIGHFCYRGKADDFLGVLLPIITSNTSHNFIWRKILQKIFTKITDRHLEATVTYIVKNLPWYGCMKWIFNDLILQNSKFKFLLLHKLLLMKHFPEPTILKNIIGYISDDKTTEHLVAEMLQKLLSVWSDSSAVKHVSYEQHKYVTQAILICIAHLTDDNTKKFINEMTMWLAPGMSSHLDSTDPKIRKLGMIVGEAISRKTDIKGNNKLDFGYEKDAETEALVELLTLEPPPSKQYYEELSLHCENTEDQILANLNTDVSSNESYTSFTASKATFLKVISGSVPKTKEESKVVEEVSETVKEDTEDLDSDDDDDLQPYDMSNDTVYKRVKTPVYIRDCMEGLLQNEDREKMEVCLGCVRELIEKDPVAAREVSLELCKILLLLEDTFALDDFAIQRISSMVALAVIDPEKVAGYLTFEFYAENYSLQHRLDILEVLLSASGALSAVEKGDGVLKNSANTRQKEIHSPNVQESWREIVDRRIESKTRRFGKGKKMSIPPKENQFGPVAGCFFYPLLAGYDKRVRTMDLLGTDSLVLGRLLYAVGTIVYSAINTLAVNSMAKSLLEFVLEVRFHSESYVRQGALYCITMAVISAGKSLIEIDTMGEITEWVNDVMNHDTSTKTQELAMQTAIMMKTYFSKELGIK